MATSSLAVANMALARLGEPNIAAIAAGNDTGGKVFDLYEPTVLNLLSMHRWRFARARQSLTKDGAFTPVTEWTNGFTLPTYQTDIVGQPIKVYRATEVGSRSHTDYEIQGRYILTNDDVCVIEYTQRTGETVWPGYFEALAAEALASFLALPVTENQSKEQYHAVRAFGTPGYGGRGGMFAAAVQSDSMANPSESLIDQGDPISAARFGGV